MKRFKFVLKLLLKVVIRGLVRGYLEGLDDVRKEREDALRSKIQGGHL